MYDFCRCGEVEKSELDYFYCGLLYWIFNRKSLIFGLILYICGFKMINNDFIVVNRFCELLRLYIDWKFS